MAKRADPELSNLEAACGPVVRWTTNTSGEIDCPERHLLLPLVPTIVVCAIIGISFVFGASAPDNLFRDPRRAPWDRFTSTKVTSEQAEPLVGGEFRPVLEPIDLATSKMPSNAQYN